MSTPWFRVPVDVAKALTGDHKATKAEATVDLLGRWHLGGEPSIGELRRAWGWSADRVIALRKALAAWARTYGAAHPDSIEIGRRPDGDRTDGSTANAGDLVGIGRGSDGDRTPHARGSLYEEEMRLERVGEMLTEDPVSDLPPHPEEPMPTTLDLPALLNGDATLIAPLTAVGIVTVGALAAQTVSSVRMVSGIGPKRALVLAAALARHGLTFRVEPMPKGKRETERPGLRDLGDRWCRAFQHVTGETYKWSARGQTSDGKAAAGIYDAFGWSETPDDATVADVGDTVRRYLRHCQAANPPRVPTLHDLARNLSTYRQSTSLVDATRARVRVDSRADAERRQTDALSATLAHFGAINAVPES